MTSVDARKLGCWSLFQVGAFEMIELLKTEGHARREMAVTLA